MLHFKDDNWFINGPEVPRLLEEFEIFLTVDEEGVLEYHDSSASVAKQFLNEVKIFLGAMDDLCNPFLDESFHLYSLDTKVVLEQNVTRELMQVEHTGKKKLLKWVETRLHQKLCPITNTICKKNLKIFRKKKSRCSLRKQEKSTIAKNNVTLWSRMYISCQTRAGNLKNFFSQENQKHRPPDQKMDIFDQQNPGLVLLNALKETKFISKSALKLIRKYLMAVWFNI